MDWEAWYAHSRTSYERWEMMLNAECISARKVEIIEPETGDIAVSYCAEV